MRTHKRHAAAHLLIGTLIEGREHMLVRPALKFLAPLGLRQIPQCGHIGHACVLTGRHLPIRGARMACQSVEQGQTMHEQGGPGASDGVIPCAEHLAAAPGLLEQGVALRHATPVGARQVGVTGAQLHAKVVEGGPTHAGTAFDHIQMIGAKKHARQNPAHAGGRTSLAVTAKRALAVLNAQPHIEHAAIALESQLEPARARAVVHELGSGGMPKRGAARQKLQRLYKVGLSRRVGSRKHRHAFVQVKTVAIETAVARDGKVAGKHGHGAALDANRHDQVQIVDLVVGLKDTRLRVALELQRDLLLLG